MASYSPWLTAIYSDETLFSLVGETESSTPVLIKERPAPFQMSVDGWIEHLLKLGYGKVKHFKQSES